MKQLFEKVCPVCGKKFMGNHLQKYCSNECRYAMHRFKYVGTCSHCGRKVYHPSKQDINMYGCQFCRNKRIAEKTPIDEQLELAKEYLIKKKFIKQYNEDHNSNTFQSVDLVDIEVAKEYLQITNQNNEPIIKEVNNNDSKLIEFEQRIIELEQRIIALENINKQYEKTIYDLKGWTVGYLSQIIKTL